MNIKFDSDPVCGNIDKYVKIKIKTHDGNVNTNLQRKKVSKQNDSYKCLSLIMLDSIEKVNKNYYPQTLLEERKYEIKRTKIENLINDDFKKSLSDEFDDDCNDEIVCENKKDNDKTESKNEIDNDESNK